MKTWNNQTLRSAGNNDEKTLLLQRCALPKFHVMDGPNTRNRFRVKEEPNASDVIAFCELHSFLVEVQTNAGYIHAMHV